MGLQTEIENSLKSELKSLFKIDSKTVEFETFDIDGKISMKKNDNIIHNTLMDKKIDIFAKNFSTKLAQEILKLKIDLNTASNPNGKLIINGANGGGAVVYTSAVQPNGALIDSTP